MTPLAVHKEPGETLNILCLGAHSDDIEIGCGGSILRLLAELPKTQLHWVVFSAEGEREAEARASARDFLAQASEHTVLVQSFRESYFPYVAAEIKDFFEQLKRTPSPDMIFTHCRADRHQDHRLVAELTWNTFRHHLILEYEVPKYEGDLGLPNLFVPLPRAVADRKVSLLERHFSSQATRAWFRADTFHGLMSVRGVECNAPEARAEAFHAAKLVM